MVSVRPGAQIAAGGQVRLLFGCQLLPTVGPDEQPCRAGARGGAFGVVGQRRDPVQRRVHPETAGHHCNHEHEQQCDQHPAPTTFAPRSFRLPRWCRRRWLGPRRAGRACGAARGDAGPVGAVVAVAVRGLMRRSGWWRGRVRGPRRPVVGIAPDHLRRLLATASVETPLASWGPTRRLPAVVHSKNVRRPRPTAASSSGPPPTRSRRTPPRR